MNNERELPAESYLAEIAGIDATIDAMLEQRPPCIHCKARISLNGKRGLCHKCYFTPTIREAYPRRTCKPVATVKNVKHCRHCERELNPNRRLRGLCWSCHSDTSIRELYTRVCERTHDHEPTMEEIDALIAEQMKKLPKGFGSPHVEPSDQQPIAVRNMIRTGRAWGGWRAGE